MLVVVTIPAAISMVINAGFLGKGLKELSKLSVMSWNVNGIRSFLKHDGNGDVLQSLIKKRRVDVLCLQETKLQSSHVADIDLHMRSQFDITRSFWSCSTARKGYSGTAVLLLNTNGHFHTMDEYVDQVSYGIGEAEGDIEGRSITIETDSFSLVNTYVPNSGAELARLGYRTSKWDVQLAKHIENLTAKRKHPVLLVGDLNIAHTAMDYHNPHEPRTKSQAGTTPEEQRSFGDLFLQQCGMVDTFRARYPNDRRYSYFSARLGARGRQAQLGMRLDYVLHHDGRGLRTDGGIGTAEVGAQNNGGNESSGGSVHSPGISDGTGSAGDRHGNRGVRVLDAYIEDEVRLCLPCGFVCVTFGPL